MKSTVSQSLSNSLINKATNSVITPNSCNNSYIAFPKSSAFLLEDQDSGLATGDEDADLDWVSGGDIKVGNDGPTVAENDAKKDRSGYECGCFGTLKESSLPDSASYNKFSQNSLVSLWNALKLKRAQVKHQNSSSYSPNTIRSCCSSPIDNSSNNSNRSGNKSILKTHHSFEASFSICKVLRKSVPRRRLKHKSKSDNCLHKIGINYNSTANNKLGSHHDLRVNGCIVSAESNDNNLKAGAKKGISQVRSWPGRQSSGDREIGPGTNRFTKKVIDQLTNAISYSKSSNNNICNSNSTHCTVSLPITNSFSSENSDDSGGHRQQLIKTRSLEKEIEDSSRLLSKRTRGHTWRKGRNWCSREESQRRSRSLERNHRYLVTLDSSCRYSREVGSQQVNLDQLSTSSNHRERLDLIGRYQPDPTFSKTRKNKKVALLEDRLSPNNRPSGDELSLNFTHVQINEALVEKALQKGNKMQQHHPSTLRAPTTQSDSSIINKPVRGWLHPENLFASDGINYTVRYIGCLEVNTSMKVLAFDTRSAIAKECINRVCEGAGIRKIDKNRRVDRKIVSMLGETPIMQKAGANVQLTITSLSLKLSDLDTGQAIFVHDMPNISFASGGESETLDFVAYVAKDKDNVRSCFVLECGDGLAQEVITTIGQAFELRFKEFLKRGPPSAKPPSTPVPITTQTSSSPNETSPKQRPPTSKFVPRNARKDEVEYYNDLPGKRPPPIPIGKEITHSNNLIDFNTELPMTGHGSMNIPGLPLPSTKTAMEAGYVNGALQAHNNKKPRDPFDMSPFSTQPPAGTGIPSPLSKHPPSFSQFNPIEAQKFQLLREDWFHGPIPRHDAECLLLKDGDFLVRESQGSKGQYVLTGMQSNSKKHLLLVDREGVVRTKDRTFESVSHLIDYHRDNNLPIISAESALRLKNPVPNKNK